jgi:hypothetical protein
MRTNRFPDELTTFGEELPKVRLPVKRVTELTTKVQAQGGPFRASEGEAKALFQAGQAAYQEAERRSAWTLGWTEYPLQ